MQTRHHPLKWPTVITVTLLCFFAGVFGLPASWINLIFSPVDRTKIPPKKHTTSWMAILPPLAVESISEINPPIEDEKPPKQTTPPPEDPGWWTAAWQVKTTQESLPLMESASRDSVVLLLETLGVGLDFSRKALPDSVLEHKLMLLRIEDGFKFDELKPYLAALGKARAMADISSRKADMYDNHLGSQIMTPD